MTLSIITASTRRGRFGPTVATWFMNAVRERRPGIDLKPLDLAAHDPITFGKTIDESDAVAMVTPEYNHSFPGPLKAAIDDLRGEWFAKPVGFVTYGGISGGLRAAEQLRLVLGGLHAVPVRDTISFPYAQRAFTPDGVPKDEDAVNEALDRFLASLEWWAVALAEATARHPFPAAS